MNLWVYYNIPFSFKFPLKFCSRNSTICFQMKTNDAVSIPETLIWSISLIQFFIINGVSILVEFSFAFQTLGLCHCWWTLCSWWHMKTQYTVVSFWEHQDVRFKPIRTVIFKRLLHYSFWFQLLFVALCRHNTFQSFITLFGLWINDLDSISEMQTWSRLLMKSGPFKTLPMSSKNCDFVFLRVLGFLLSTFLLYTPHCHIILAKQTFCLW